MLISNLLYSKKKSQHKIKKWRQRSKMNEEVFFRKMVFLLFAVESL